MTDESKLKSTHAPPITDPKKELHKPEIHEVVATPKDAREPNPIKHAIHLLQQLRKQGLWTTLIEAVDQIYRRVTGAPLERFSRVTPSLHVGGQFTRRGWHTLRERGVTAGVSLRGEYDPRNAEFNPEKYLYLPTVDNHAPTLEALREGVDFIRDEIARGGQVYVHCWEGVGRGPTMAAAYLVSTGLTPSESWGKLKATRPFIRPTVAQLQQIDLLAEQYRSADARPLSEKLPSVPTHAVTQGQPSAQPGD
jgi:dual specificity MAP kinase phosphatase